MSEVRIVALNHDDQTLPSLKIIFARSEYCFSKGLNYRLPDDSNRQNPWNKQRSRIDKETVKGLLGTLFEKKMFVLSSDFGEIVSCNRCLAQRVKNVL